MKKSRVIYFCMFFLTLLFLNLSFAQYDWANWGGSYSPLWNAQYPTAKSNFQFGWNYTEINKGYYPFGSKKAQPLSMYINDTKELYVLPQNNYLQVYNANFVLLDEINTGGTIVSQYDVERFDLDYDKDILGIFKVGNILIFKAYTFNGSNNKFYLLSENNFTGKNWDYIYGLRGQTGKSFAIVGNSTQKTATFLTMSWNTTSNLTDITEISLCSWKNSPSTDFFSTPAWTDLNSDGKTEYMIWTSKEVLIFDENGNTEFKYNATNDIYDVKLLQTDYTGDYRVAILTEDLLFPSYLLNLYRLDGSLIWAKNIGSLPFTAENDGIMAIVSYFDGDFSDNEIYVALSPKSAYQQSYLALYVIKGYNGNILANYNSGNYSVSSSSKFKKVSLTLADMNGNNIQDFIVTDIQGTKCNLQVYDISTYTFLVNSNLSSGSNKCNCIPTDIDLNGFQEIICMNEDITRKYYSTTANQNAQISSVSYSPSISIILGETLITFTNATDYEGNTIRYKIKCSNDNNWSIDTATPTQSCYFTEVGIFNVSIAVRDEYHTIFESIFSQNIIVTQTGTICGNSICEAGENNVNCPQDCPTAENYTQATETGGIPIPLKIVDTQNTEQGLLPEIYFGILGFLSNTLSPLIILVFVIFFVLIILTIGTIIKKIAHRVGEMS